MVVLRSSNPDVVRPTWEVIEVSHVQKHGAEVEKLMKGLQQHLETYTEEELREELSRMVADDLILLKEKNGKDHYVLPDEKCCERDSHDWYCFKCHMAGDVLRCKSCPRVFHRSCIDAESEPFQCSMCQDALHPEADFVKDNELNLMLQFVCKVVKEKVKILQKYDRSEPIKDWKKEYLCFQQIDTTDIQEKVNNNMYKSVHEFQVDIETCMHNTIILYGQDTIQATLAEAMVKECTYEIDEMRQCTDCYRYSNEKACKEWFCLPCKKPHELVYAKIKGFPFWPGKVIRYINGKYDVRFFGGRHERSLIDSDNMKPVSEENKIPVKKSQAFTKARTELKKHMELIEEAKKGIDVVTMLCGAQTEGNAEQETLKKGNSNLAEESGKKPKGGKTAVKRKASVESEKKEAKKAKLDTSKKRQSTPVREVNNLDNAGSSSSHTDPDEFESPTYKEKIYSDFPKIKEGKGGKQQRYDDGRSAAEEKALKQMKKLKQRLRFLSLKNSQLEETIEKMKLDAELAKRHHWCYMCGSPAKYYCCWNGSYCSSKCQMDHWKRKHRKMCKRVNREKIESNTEPTAEPIAVQA